MKGPIGSRPSNMPRVKMVTPNYSQRTPIVNDAHFTDGPPLPTATSAMASYNPGQSAAPLPNGPPRFIQPQGKRIFAKGLTNKRIPGNI